MSWDARIRKCCPEELIYSIKSLCSARHDEILNQLSSSSLPSLSM